MLEETFGVKERRACRVVGQHRSTQRLGVPLPSDDEQNCADGYAFARTTRAGVGSGPPSTFVERASGGPQTRPASVAFRGPEDSKHGAWCQSDTQTEELLDHVPIHVRVSAFKT